MATFGGPRFPGIVNDGLVFAIDPLNKESWAGPNSTLVKNLRDLDSSFSGSILNDTSGSLGPSGSFNFDGVDDKIDASMVKLPWDGTTGFGQTPTYSFSMWARHNGNFTGNYQEIVLGNLVGSFYNFQGFFAYHATGTDLTLRIDSTFGSTQLGTDWHNITGVNDKENGRKIYYLDGVEEVNIASSSVTNLSLILGDTSRNNYDPWIGEIGPFLFYQKALTALEVSQNYNQLKPRFT